jgi:hypothetical protein
MHEEAGNVCCLLLRSERGAAAGGVDGPFNTKTIE